MFKKWREVILLSSFLVPIPIQAVVIRATPVLQFNASAPTQTLNGGSLGWTGQVATGYGLITSVSLFGSPFDFEVGGIFQDEASERSQAGKPLLQEFHRIHLPVLVRYHLDENMSLGLGGYAGIASGKVLTQYDGATSIASFSDSGIREQDLGLVISARASFHLFSDLSLLIDGRYLHGLTNLDATSPGFPGNVRNTRSMQAYLGLSYQFTIN